MEPSDSSSKKEKNEEQLNNIHLNRRRHNRYIVREFSIGDIGTVTEISQGGIRIKKLHSEEITDSQLTVHLFDTDLETDIIWQDKNYLGLRYDDELEVVQLIKALTKRIIEPKHTPKRVIPDDTVSSFSKKDLSIFCINLMVELENPDTDINQLKTYIREISDACKESADQDTDESQGTEEAEGSAPAVPEGLDQLLIFVANEALSASEAEITDIDFAVSRLGLDSVKKISTEFLRKKISVMESSLSNFNNYETYAILKTVIFRHLAHFFGFRDDRGEGSLVLSLETKGLDVLMGLSSDDEQDMKDYYISSTRVYSEVSRKYEKNYFGRDLLMVSKFYFEKKLGMFKDLYDGYIFAHLMLNPHYMFSSNIRLDLTKRKLTFSYLAYLTFLATKFLMDKDRESAFILLHMLKRTDMDDGKIMDFLAGCINEANSILKDFGLPGNIKNSQMPHTSFKVEGYVHKDIYFKYLIRAFEDFSTMKSIRRMALRYEDTAYAHFILSKFLIADNIGLNSKTYCVIPCQNISEHELYLEDFSNFDLVIFKDIDSLPLSHMKAFIKLWDSYEGKIIVTFCNYSFLDFDNQDLYLLLMNHIVDFPSYFSNRGIYERMIDHTINYIKPYVGEGEIDRKKYEDDIFSMDYIKTNELSSYV
jgi:hypothetical protein